MAKNSPVMNPDNPRPKKRRYEGGVRCTSFAIGPKSARFASMSQQSENATSNSSIIAMLYDPTQHSTLIGQPSTSAVVPPVYCGDETLVDYLDMGDPTYKCGVCDAYFWYDEKLASSTSKDNPVYSKCCGNGKVHLPALTRPPDILFDLLFGSGPLAHQFRNNIRGYNCMFSFTSMGGKIDSSLNDGRSPPTFRLHGANYHSLGSLLPCEGRQPRFAQLYIYDTDHEIANRIKIFRLGDDDLHHIVVSSLQHMLDTNNVLVKSFRTARDGLACHGASNLRLRLIAKRTTDLRTYNLPPVSEVAALIVGDFDSSLCERDIVVETQCGRIQRINQLHPAYLGLQYPLLFPYGEDGYTENIPFRETYTGKIRKKISEREYFAYRLHDRAGEVSTILFARRLFQQFVVDAYTIIESARLLYFRENQPKLRAEMYQGLQDAVARGEAVEGNRHGKRIVLPSSFIGGPRYMIQNYQDAMAICSWAGFPKLFLTFTCNSKWPEIVRFVQSKNLNVEDRYDVVSRIFKIKLEALMKDLRRKEIFGKVQAVIYTVEYQKRGLPHAHILLFLGRQNRLSSDENVDDIITAEIPDSNVDPYYYKCVEDLMVHGPCGILRPTSPCMVDGKCVKHYPKKFVDRTSFDGHGYPTYRRRDNGRIVVKNGIPLDNRFVVPHNRFLLLKYGGHLNVEWCNQSRAVKYLFKYINKGQDRVTAAFYNSAAGRRQDQECNEINMYCDCRYISPCEATWRIFGFDIHFRNPPVERLNLHLPGQQNVIFSDSNRIDVVLDELSLKDNKFLAWMEANKKYEEARCLTYTEFPTKFVWKGSKWELRQRGFGIGRIYNVPPGSGEKYYLRCLLNLVRGPTSFEAIRCINGVQYNSFRDAMYALGLLDDDREYIDGIKDASAWASSQTLRRLFVTLLSSNTMSKPTLVWDKCWSYLADDIVHKHRFVHGGDLTDNQIKQGVLIEVEKLMQAIGRTLNEFPDMQYEDINWAVNNNDLLLVHGELNYDIDALQQDYADFLSKCTLEQLQVHDKILDAISVNEGGFFFVYGCGGTGKTFLWNGLSAAVRSRGEIVINVASSGIASLLLPGGRTAHSRFKIPLEVTEETTCNITQGSPLAHLIIKATLIIWDEAPMLNKFCFEALDKTLSDIMFSATQAASAHPFGGKLFVLGGDFRQILPVVPKGSRQDVVSATINSSYLWSHCTVLKLTKNMRLHNVGSTPELVELQAFSNMLQSIGDGLFGGPNDGEFRIQLPRDLLLQYVGDPVAAIVKYVYMDNANSLVDAMFLQERAILAPTLDAVESINEYVISIQEGVGRLYLSSDSVCKSGQHSTLFEEIHSPEFLNTLTCSGLPNHRLFLKQGTPIMLLRNIDPTNGLCNGTRLVLTKLGDHILEARVITGKNTGDKVLIPRISLTPSDLKLPFSFQRRQFPIIVCYAMTINKSQGQSLKRVGLYLEKDVFTHGQLYVAMSRVTNRCGLKILLGKTNPAHITSTKNVVFKEVYRNL